MSSLGWKLHTSSWWGGRNGVREKQYMFRRGNKGYVILKP
jgi:hypothetical protein